MTRAQIHLAQRDIGEMIRQAGISKSSHDEAMGRLARGAAEAKKLMPAISLYSTVDTDNPPTCPVVLIKRLARPSTSLHGFSNLSAVQHIATVQAS
jgi:hypothetical protein